MRMNERRYSARRQELATVYRASCTVNKYYSAYTMPLRQMNIFIINLSNCYVVRNIIISNEVTVMNLVSN